MSTNRRSISKKQYRCEKCKEMFQSIELKKEHMTTEHKEYKYICDKCGKSYKKKGPYDNDVEKCGKIYEKEGPYNNDMEKCRQKVEKNEELEIHVEGCLCTKCKRKRRVKYQCEVCKKTLKNLKELKEHNEYDSNELDNENKCLNEAPYGCEICNIKFIAKTLYDKHTNAKGSKCKRMRIEKDRPELKGRIEQERPIKREPTMPDEIKIVTIKKTGNKIKKIYHISDIHIKKDQTRINEFTDAFKKMYEKIDERGIEDSVMVITGDIFDLGIAKNDITEQLFLELTLGIMRRMDLIIIGGNHDYTKEKRDAIGYYFKDKRIKNYKNKQAYYFDKTGGYIYENILFGLSSRLDDKYMPASALNETAKELDLTLIGLYHGQVGKVYVSNGHQLGNGNGFKKKHFDGYKYVLLGDIHIHTYLGEGRRMAYASSLLQTNVSEDHPHGLIEWNIEENTSEFHQLNHDWGYKHIEIDNGEIRIIGPTELPKNIRLIVKYENTEYLKVKEIIREFIINKNLSEMAPAVITEKAQMRIPAIQYNDKVINENNSTTQLAIDKVKRLIIQYYKTMGTAPQLSREEAMNMTDKYEIMLNREFNIVNIKRKWRILKISFDYMFTYGKGNILDFENKNVKLISLDGSTSRGGNSRGKSTIFNIILFALYKTYPGQNLQRDILNKILQTELPRCIIYLEIEGESYMIIHEGHLDSSANTENERSKHEPAIKVYSYYYKKINGEYVQEKELEGTIDLSKYIIETIGDIENMLYTNVMMQQPDNILMESDPTKIDYFLRLEGLEIFTYLYKIAHKEYTRATGALNLKRKELTDKFPSKKDYDKEIKEVEQNINEQINYRTEENDQISIISKQINEIDKEISELKVDSTKNYKELLKNAQKKNINIEQDISRIHKTLDELTLNIEEIDLQIKRIYGEWDSNKPDNLNTIIEKKKKMSIDQKLELENEVKNNEKKKIKLFDISNIKEEYKLDNKYSTTKVMNHLITLSEKQNIIIAEYEDDINKIQSEMTNVMMTKNIEDVKKGYTDYTLKESQLNKLEKDIDQLKIKIKSNEDILNDLKTSGYIPNPQCEACRNNPLTKNYNVYTTIISNLNEELQNQQNKFEYLNIELDSIIDLKIQYTNYIDNLAKYEHLEKKLKDTQNKLAISNSSLKNINNQINICKKNITNIEHNKNITNEILTYTKQIDDINNKINEYDIGLKNISSHANIKLEIYKQKEELDNKTKLMNEISQNITRYTNILAVNENIERVTLLKKEKNKLELNVAEREKIIDNLKNERYSLEQQITEKQKMEMDCDKLEIDLSKKKEYAKMVSRRYVPALALLNLLKRLEKKTNEYLDGTDPNIILKFEYVPCGTEAKLIKHYTLLSNGESGTVQGGFENFMVNFCFRLALIDDSNITCCTNLFIDEGFTSASVDNLDYIATHTFVKLREKFDFCLFISHFDVLKIACDERILIYRDLDISYVNNLSRYKLK